LNLLGYNYGIPRLPLTQISKEKEELLKNELLKFSN
jgi:dihydrodipicolinate synthase/N-acetylneuraminate lyase